MMGSGGLIVLDEDNCMVDIAKFFLDFTVDESCGKCTPCRIGTKRMLEYSDQDHQGQGTMDDARQAGGSSAMTSRTTPSAALGQTAPNPVLSTMQLFP
jgi:NADH:ubiquinone oxidoreductase subunit F (NADH-binding)